MTTMMKMLTALAVVLALSGAALAEEAKDAEDAKRISVGDMGWWKPGALLQGWFLYDGYGEYYGKDSKGVAGVQDGVNASTFRIRRAELSVKGEILKSFIFGAMIDPAHVSETKDTVVTIPDPKDPTKTSTATVKAPLGNLSALQDFWVGYTTEWADVAMGQFKIPVSYEGFNSSSKLLFPERALVSKQYGDKRDVGIKVSKSFKYAGYVAGVWNGSGQNTLDTNNSKDLGLRLEAYPVKGLTVGGVAYYTAGERDDKTNANMKIQDRYEVDLRYENYGVLFQAEYIMANDGKAGKNSKTGDAEVQETPGNGWYAALAYTFMDKLQPAIRYGELNLNTDKGWHQLDLSKAKPMARHLDVGLNYYIHKNEAKLQLAYSRIEYDGDKDGTKLIPLDNQVILAAQVSY